jgi:hypothetical protein
MDKIGRKEIIASLVSVLEPLDYVYALWEGGAVGFDRVDEWSDIDIHVDVDDDHVEDVFPIVENAMSSLSPIELKYEVPQPTWHGHAQAFYRLESTSKFLIIDLAVMKHSNPNKFLQQEKHGKAIFHFNKNNAVKLPSLDIDKLINDLRDRLESIQKRFDMFQCFVEKGQNRGNHITALDFYYRVILDSLVEVLLMKYEPIRHDHGAYYIHYDLSEDVVAKLKWLFFVKNEEELEEKSHYAEDWFHKTVKEIDLKKIEEHLKHIKDNNMDGMAKSEAKYI